MKTLYSSALVICSFIASNFAQAENWKFSTSDDPHNILMFEVDHQGFSTSRGFFTDFHGVLNLDEENLENSSVWAEVNTNSVDIAQHETWTNNTKNMFLDSENHPTMKFQSTSVTDLGDGKMEIVGDLSMVGITKSITMDAKLNRIGQYMDVGQKAGFSATASLTRTDWGIDAILDLIPEQVDIVIEIEAFPEDMAVEH